MIYERERVVHQQPPPPEDEQSQPTEISPEEKRQLIRKQLTYYFSEQNIVNDKFLMSNMDHEDYVSISMIANFNMLRRLTDDLQLITDILKELPSVEVDADEKLVRSTIIKKNRLTGKRCIIILRDVPSSATESEISELFANEHCPVRALSCERVLDSGESGCWYVTFNSEDDAQNAFLYLTRENVLIRGQKVLARMKARLRQIPTSVPSTNVSTPVSPPMPVNTNNGGATSPPPTSQQPIQSYPTTNFPSQQQQQQQAQIQSQQHQQQQQPQQLPTASQQQLQQQQSQVQQQPPQSQAAPLSMPQYSSQLHQQSYNPSQVHSPLYMQAAPNQNSILGNLQASTTSYRHPMHSSMGPAHLAAQYSSNNQSQHPTSMDHPSSLPHIRMAYPNYHNIQYDRTAWGSTGGPHQSSVQNSQAALSYASANSQANMTSYHQSLAHQAQFLAANPNLFPGSFVYMPTTAYSTNEPYQTMPYNNPNKQKIRTTRDHPSSSRPRNSTRPLGARNSRQEGLQMANEHPNDLLDYGTHSTPHSEGSSSPVPRAEVPMNRPNDPLVTAVSNLSLQHVPTYPSNSMDTSAIDQEHYQSHPANDILYINKANSHQIQPQTSSDSNPSQEQTNESQAVGKYPAQSSYPTSTSMNNSKVNPVNYQPLEQRTAHMNNSEQSNSNPTDDNQQQMNKKPMRSSTSQEQSQSPIPPLMTRDGRPTQNSNRPSSSQQTGRPQQQQQQQQQGQGRPNSTNNHSSSSTPLSVTVSKVSSVTYYNQTSAPQSPNTNQKNQSTAAAVAAAQAAASTAPSSSSQQIVNDNNGPRSYADMLKLKQAPQKATDPNKSTISPPNESNDLSSSRAQSPAINTKIDSVSTSGIASSETNGPSSSSSSDLSPSNPPELLNAPSSASTTNDSNVGRRNSSASDHPQQSSSQQQQQQQPHSSPSHQQYNNSRGRGNRGGNYRYANDRRSNANNNVNRGGGGRGGAGAGRRSMNTNNSGPNGPPPYQSRGSGGRGNNRFFDRPRGGGGNYHNSNQTVHRFTGNTGNVEPQVHYTD